MSFRIFGSLRSLGSQTRRALLISLIAAFGLARVAAAQTDPNQGPGGPILVITSSSATFSKYYAEILRNEGLNSFAVVDIGSVTSTILANYDVAILGSMTLSGGQVTTLTNWVNGGGNLIAMAPDSQLASLLGLTSSTTTLANAYVLFDGSTRQGSGIANTTLQFHGTAKRFTLNGATSLATLYSNASTATTNPAVTLRSVGSAGGQAAFFAFDLATSIVQTRQGNPAWATQERDGQAPVRSDDKFFGASASDPQADWIDLSKVAIPQADEQMRFLANLIISMGMDRKPLPRFWYLPNRYHAAVLMTGDDHANGGTAGQFDRMAAASPPNCSLDNWECLRGTSYIYTATPFSNSQAVGYNAQGFEIGLHVNTDCLNYTQDSLTDTYDEQLGQWADKYSGLPDPVTMRHHCIVWSDWASGAKVELAHGIRLDTTYYYWPPEWVDDVPGHFTGSAMPMRFADTNGSIIDVYQAVSQMTDESGQVYPFTSDTLLDRAVGLEEQYGVYTVNAHTDTPISDVGDAVIGSAVARGVPVIAARQMLKWLDARNRSAFSAITYSNDALSFTVTPGAGATGLIAMVPRSNGNRVLSGLTRGGNAVSYEVMSVKGYEYVSFSATAGTYVASYAVDSSAPTITARFPSAGGTNVSTGVRVAVTFSKVIDPATLTSTTFELRNSANAVVPSTLSYSASSLTASLQPNAPLTSGATYTVNVRGGTTDPRIKDLAGNALAATSSWTFTTGTVVADGCPCTGFPGSAAPSDPLDPDPTALEVGVKFRSDVNGYVTGVRFYKGTGNGGTHIGSLWSSTGSRLATAQFMNETATGWQQVNFTTPVQITANTVYVASYFAPQGHIYGDNDYFTSGVDRGMLHFPSSNSSGGNGVFKYGTTSAFPDESWNASNYWVDVVFSTTANVGPDTTAPTVTITTPSSSTSFGVTTSSLTLGGTASDNVGVTSVTWTNDRGGGGTALGTSTWTANGIALQPGANLITVTARDAANNSSSDATTVTYTVDTTAPTITTRTPAPSATGVSAATSVTAVFSEALDPATVSASTFELRNASNGVVAASVSYNATTMTATLTPNAPLALTSTYTATIRGGSTEPRVKDASGNALAANATWSFTTAADQCPCSLWAASAAPNVASENDSDAVTLGVKFRSDINGFIRGIRFYKGTGNSGTHVGTLWSANGSLMASATFQNETATGWQQVTFTTPIAIAANTTYVASYFAPAGHYAADLNGFAVGVDNGVLHAPSDSAGGGNGVFAYGTTNQFPNETSDASNYWVDVVFASTSGTAPDTTPPTISTRTPAASATGVDVNSPVTVTFSEAMDPSSIGTTSIELRTTSGSTLVPSNVTYDASTFTATLQPTSNLNLSTSYTVRVHGGTTDPRVKDVAGNALAADSTWSFTTGSTTPCSSNPIAAENCLVGNPASEWDIVGAGDVNLQGFATQISVNRGQTIQFKVKTSYTGYRFDIYRMGYYNGMGARKITSFNPTATLPQNQPSCISQPQTGLLDCGNWAVSGSWTVPSTATSGIYFARLVRTVGGSGASHIMFIVRDDASTSPLVFQTSDTTWQAYNNYGGNSLYLGGPGTNPGRAYKVSYNRPFNTRAVDNGQDWVFNAEYPMVRWLESNGYNVSYISGVDTDRSGALLLNHKVFLSVGHDEYWSAAQRANVEAARAAGKHLAFFSGNEMFWKVRWENSIDAAPTAYRTLVSYKETHANAKIDPTSTWTGTWRDPRFSPPGDGGRPENSVTGQLFMVNDGTTIGLTVPADDGKMRFWRNTNLATQSAGGSIEMTSQTIGYEFDEDVDNGFRPPGQIRLSTTTAPNMDYLQDYGSTYDFRTATHTATMYKHPSGAIVFGAGTIQWSWGLDGNHDRGGSLPDTRIQQGTVNLFADMGVTASTLRPGLVQTSASTDTVAPTSVVVSPMAGTTVQQNTPVTISGTASDTGGGVVGGVEVSVDGGTTWRRANGRANWTYTWTPTTLGSATIRTRAADDSGNLQTPGAGTTVTVGVASPGGCPCTLFSSTTVPVIAAEDDPGPVELGVKFKSDVGGFITGIRFYKASSNTGTHVAHLWNSSGALLATANFINETSSGWQQVNFATPIAITAGATYTASYWAPNGHYAGDNNFFNTGVDRGVLHAPSTSAAGGNGVFTYDGLGVFPAESWMASNYYVDVVFTQ